MAVVTKNGDSPSDTSGGGWLDRFLAKIGCLWDIFQDLGAVLKILRLSLLVTALVGIILIFVDQGQELLIIQAEDFWGHWAFYPAVVFWALNAWYWARTTLTHGAAIPWRETCAKPYLGGRLKRVNWLVEHLPRLIGAGAFGMIAIAQIKAVFQVGFATDTAWNLVYNAVAALVLAVIFYLFALRRRRGMGWVEAKVDPHQKSRIAQSWLAVPIKPRFKPKSRVRELPLPARGIFFCLLVVLVVTFIMASADPVTLGRLGPEVVLLVGASLWIAPASWLFLVDRRRDLPVVTIILILGFAFSFTNDNHELRTIDEGGADPIGERPTPSEALGPWREPSEAQTPLVMVATAGGGSRAAYWTAGLLGTIQDIHPNFDRQLFGISGVSGGSLGAAVYRGLLTALPSDTAECAQLKPKGKGPYRACAQAVLAEDYLGAVLAGTLYPDLVQRILPWGVLPDRAEALEKAWERAWRSALGGKDPNSGLMAGSFFGAWPPRNEELLPALFLNGTSVGTGKRIVTSNLNLSTVLTDAFDFFEHWPGYEIRLSTATNNSARFPLIEPAGTLKREATDSDKDEHSSRLDRIVDGGYFENFGAATALDILQNLAKTSSDSEDWRRLVVIQISSDPDYPGVVRNDGPGTRRDASPGSFAGELRSPLKALLNTRTARGVLAAQRLHDWTEDKGGTFVEFRLLESPNMPDPPLGWTLSVQATENIDCQIKRPKNLEQLRHLADALGFSLERLDEVLGTKCPTL